ncbi:MAG: EVE domain-containing protein [bacterium]|nr:EVE domain-containing protein [bacterium]
MNYFLVKADPETDYSIDDLKRDKKTIWDGVHNNAALLHIRAMKLGDLVFIYHSQKQKSVVGLAKVTGEPYENTSDPRRNWAVELCYVRHLDKPVTLAEIKTEKAFANFALVKIGRLSVMPVPVELSNKLLSMSVNNS